MIKGSSLGSLRFGEIFLPAFGPQRDPLNDPSSFGIEPSVIDTSWYSVFANKEIWFEKSSREGGLDLKFVGLLDHSIHFVFYVQAEIAEIGDKRYLPGTLQRYSGEEMQVLFSRGKETLLFHGRGPHRMELIPLTPSRHFWESSFLLAYTLSPHQPKISFDMTAINHSEIAVEVGRFCLNPNGKSNT